MSAQPRRKKRPAKKTTAGIGARAKSGGRARKSAARGRRTTGSKGASAPYSAEGPRRRSRKRSTRPAEATTEQGERLQKVLAAAGFGSRRQCEELITTGRVEVDRQVVTELGTRVDSQSQEIRLDGVALPRKKKLYYAVNKPQGVVSTNSDPARRPRVIDLIPRTETRLFTVGRLDMNSEGLILVTNDGELANKLTHPRYGVEKTYRVQVAGKPEREVLAQLRRGVYLAEGFARVEGVRVKSRYKDSTILEMVLREGRNREIRRLLARVGHKVLRLVRISVGPIRLGKLTSGETRQLTSSELTALRRAAGKPRSKSEASTERSTKVGATRGATTKKRPKKKHTTQKETGGKRSATKATGRGSSKKRPSKKRPSKKQLPRRR